MLFISTQSSNIFIDCTLWFLNQLHLFFFQRNQATNFWLFTFWFLNQNSFNFIYLFQRNRTTKFFDCTKPNSLGNVSTQPGNRFIGGTHISINDENNALSSKFTLSVYRFHSVFFLLFFLNWIFSSFFYPLQILTA